jgi:hypothetical protein
MDHQAVEAAIAEMPRMLSPHTASPAGHFTWTLNERVGARIGIPRRSPGGPRRGHVGSEMLGALLLADKDDEIAEWSAKPIRISFDHGGRLPTASPEQS